MKKVVISVFMTCCIIAWAVGTVGAQPDLDEPSSQNSGTVSGTPDPSEQSSPEMEPTVEASSADMDEALPTESDDATVLDPTVVSASRIEMPLSEVVSSVTVITAEDIEARKANDLKEIIQGVIGIDVAQNGGAGQVGSIFIRGAASERTLVLINGVPLQDPMSPARSTDISEIALNNVEQIEIIRGPQSVVFGSGAMGGVINIVTKQAGVKPRASLTVEGGKYNTWLTRLTAAGSLEGFSAALGATYSSTNGFSAAKRSDDFTAAHPVPAMEDDGCRHMDVDLNLDYQIDANLLVRTYSRFVDNDADIDSYGGNYGDDPNYVSETTQFQQKVGIHWQTSELWTMRLLAALSQSDRRVDDAVDEDHPSDLSRGEYRSRTAEIDWWNQFVLPLNNTLVVGTAYQQEQGMSHYYSEYLDWNTYQPTSSESQFDVRSAHQFGYYVEDRFTWQDALVILGARYDVHDQYAGHATFRVTPAYRFASLGTRIKATYGTAFNAPSLYQLYVEDAYSQGDPTLKPETSSGWDAGIEQALLGRILSVGLTYFHTEYKDQITAVSDPVTYKYVYQNLGEVETKGWEASVLAKPLKDLIMQWTYTKLTANDLTHQSTTGPEPLIRRADYQMAFDARYRLLGAELALHVNHVGPRWDSGKKRLDPYTLVHLTGSYQIVPQAQVYLKVLNLLDENYVEVTGYNTSRLAAFAGIRIELP